MNIKVGVVTANSDVTKSGIMKVGFNLQNLGTTQSEDVRYVTPYGNDKAAFMAIPEPGSTVLVAYSDAPLNSGEFTSGYYYLGSVMGANSTVNRLLGVSPGEGTKKLKKGESLVVNPPTDTNQKPGTYGPPTAETDLAIPLENTGHFPEAFKDLYTAKGITPEQIGLIGHRSDGLIISNRARANDSDAGPLQDDATELKSGSGKRLGLVDSPIVDGLVYTNEHKAKNYFIWSSGNKGNFSKGEVFLRTHGPINMYTAESGIHAWVQDGKNIEIENKSKGQMSPVANRNGNRTTNEEAGSPSSRIDDIGSEDYGCVKVWSHNNNIAVSALAENSVIHIDASGEFTKVIVRTGGTVDIVANKKITLTSETEVELNAPVVQLNGSNEVELNGPLVQLNGEDETEINAPLVHVNAGDVLDMDAGSEIDMDAGTINLN